jgi:hypothetical protein
MSRPAAAKPDSGLAESPGCSRGCRKAPPAHRLGWAPSRACRGLPDERAGAFILGRPRPLSGHRRAEHLDGDHTLDCEGPVQENPDWVDIADASDGRRRLVFQQIADYRPPGWPDQGPPQQLHLDLRVDDLEIADQRVRALGAVPLGERVVLEDETYRVYADPAGHPFCLVQLETT